MIWKKIATAVNRLGERYDIWVCVNTQSNDAYFSAFKSGLIPGFESDGGYYRLNALCDMKGLKCIGES